MTITVKKAVKHQAKLKACLVGPSGSGKTYTALTFAQALAGSDGKIMVLDSEKGSASLYSDLFNFDVAELWARDEQRRPIPEPFHPNKYMEAISYAEEHGYSVLVIDSLTHVWNDEGGFLDLVDKVSKRKARNGAAPNTFTAWSEVDPLYRKFLNAITDARLHIICTMRSKTDTLMGQDANGRTTVKKVGTKAVQREGLEYEFTLFCQMELDNSLIVEKTRCSAVRGAIVSNPTGAFMEPIIAWLNNGAPEEVPVAPEPAHASEPEQGITDQQKASIRKLCQHLEQEVPDDLDTMSYATAKALIGVLSEDYRNSRTPAKTNTSEAVADLKAYVARVFNFKPEKAEERWSACKVHVLGKPVEDAALTPADSDKIRAFATAEEQRKTAHASGK